MLFTYIFTFKRKFYFLTIKMSLNIVQALRKMPTHEQARLIGSAPQFIQDYNLINLLNLYNLNNKKNDATLIQQLVKK